ncbi:MAG: hypothetical protein JO170_30810 [Verrucomicrobia bacterium]|nr:hypothetical protein [Verrucomicrobiota bacterium]
MVNCQKFGLASWIDAVAQGIVVLMLVIGIQLVCYAGNHGTGSILMNPAVTAQKQAKAVALQVQSAQPAVHNPAQTGVSVIKGNNGVTFIRIKDPSLAPSAALRTYQSNGKTYAFDGNGVIFGGGNQVNTRGISAAAMGATSNGYTDAQTKKLTKPQRIEVPSIVTAEVVGFGK